MRSKTPVAMVNEVLAKILCNNITELVQARYTLGIEPDFSEDGTSGRGWGHLRFQSSFFEEAA